MGGLGNQLFQAAHALSQGWKHNRSVVFTPYSNTQGQGRSIENYINNVFRNIEFVDNLTEFVTLREPTFEFTEIDLNDENTCFYGYFQSSKHWYGFDKKIRDTFKPPTEVIEEMRDKYPQLNQPKTLSIHIRRGEYLQFPTIHPTVSVEYIKEAVNLVGEYSNVFIFTEKEFRWPGSIDFIMENFTFENVVFSSEVEDWKEMYLMSLCENNIISNSTFSWWGSFLNENKNKKIVAPSVWFGPEGPNYKDIYEPYWNIIPVEYDNGILKFR